MERGRTGEVFAEFLEVVHERFYLVRRDIGRYMGRFQVSHAEEAFGGEKRVESGRADGLGNRSAVSGLADGCGDEGDAG